jgi:hypothetical protein
MREPVGRGKGFWYVTVRAFRHRLFVRTEPKALRFRQHDLQGATMTNSFDRRRFLLE